MNWFAIVCLLLMEQSNSFLRPYIRRAIVRNNPCRSPVYSSSSTPPFTSTSASSFTEVIGTTKIKVVTFNILAPCYKRTSHLGLSLSHSLYLSIYLSLPSSLFPVLPFFSSMSLPLFSSYFTHPLTPNLPCFCFSCPSSILYLPFS